MTPEEDFLVQTPPPAQISRALNPPSHENFQHAIRRGGVDFFWNNPILHVDYWFSIHESSIEHWESRTESIETVTLLLVGTVVDHFLVSNNC